jgi:hypothetical protein
MFILLLPSSQFPLSPYFLLQEILRLMGSRSVCLSPLSTFEQVSRFYEIQWGGHAIEDDVDIILSNNVASTIPKWRPFELQRWLQNLHQSKWNHEIVYGDRSSEDN